MNAIAEFKPVPTRAALALQKNHKTSDFQALIFEEPKSTPNTRFAEDKEQPQRRRKYGADDDSETPKKSHTDELEFDIKKARHEVLNFAMNNQRVIKNEKKMKIFQAVKLGAKPPKKAYKNYKDLLDERKRLKEIREDRKKFHQLGKNQAGAASVKCRSKSKLEKQAKKRAPVSRIDQHYGVAKPKLKKKK